MATKIKILNGPPQITVEELTPGSQFSIALYVERETATDVWTAWNFSGYSVDCHIKAKEKDDDTSIVQEVTATPRALETGWIDLTLTGAQTLLVGAAIGDDRDCYASVKVWPTGDTNSSETLAVFIIHVKYRSVR